MDIVILGAGKSGSFTAAALSQEGHTITVVDKDARLLEKIGRELDIATLQAHLPNWKLFEELSEKHPDALIAATGDDETNLIACTIAKNLGFPKTIALVRSRDYLSHAHLDFGRLFCVDYFLSPEILAAQDLFKVLVHSGDIAVEHFAHGAIQMRTVAVPDRWDKGGIPLKDLPLPEEFIVGLIRRRSGASQENETLLFPHGEDHVLPGDEVTVVGESRIMSRLHEVFHTPERRIRSVILAGGTRVASHLAHFLCHQQISVRILESDAQRCEELIDLLPRAIIIHRDGRDSNTLSSERVQEADALVACTEEDETNLLIASLARRMGCAKVISLATDPALSPILEKLGIVPALSAQVNIANRILSILHKEAILTIASVYNDQAKIVEMKIPPHSKAVGIPLSDLSERLPKDLLIAVIENQGRVMIGRGNRILCPNDTMIVLCSPRHIPHLHELFHQ